MVAVFSWVKCGVYEQMDGNNIIAVHDVFYSYAETKKLHREGRILFAADRLGTPFAPAAEFPTKFRIEHIKFDDHLRTQWKTYLNGDGKGWRVGDSQKGFMHRAECMREAWKADRAANIINEPPKMTEAHKDGAKGITDDNKTQTRGESPVSTANTQLYFSATGIIQSNEHIDTDAYRTHCWKATDVIEGFLFGRIHGSHMLQESEGINMDIIESAFSHHGLRISRQVAIRAYQAMKAHGHEHITEVEEWKAAYQFRDNPDEVIKLMLEKKLAYKEAKKEIEALQTGAGNNAAQLQPARLSEHPSLLLPDTHSTEITNLLEDKTNGPLPDPSLNVPLHSEDQTGQSLLCQYPDGTTPSSLTNIPPQPQQYDTPFGFDISDMQTIEQSPLQIAIGNSHPLPPAPLGNSWSDDILPVLMPILERSSSSQSSTIKSIVVHASPSSSHSSIIINLRPKKRAWDDITDDTE